MTDKNPRVDSSTGNIDWRPDEEAERQEIAAAIDTLISTLPGALRSTASAAEAAASYAEAGGHNEAADTIMLIEPGLQGILGAIAAIRLLQQRASGAHRDVQHRHPAKRGYTSPPP